MIYLKWLVLVIFNLFLKYFVAYPLTPIVVLFAKYDGWLPYWLYWFQTPDNSLDGDSGWKTESRPFLNESNRFKRYLNRCFWLWRNSLYGLNESLLSIVQDGYIVMHGDGLTTNGPGGHSGWVERLMFHNGRLVAWQWYYIRRLKHFPRKCIRINLGWKLWNKPGEKAHLAFSAWINKFTP